MNRDQIILARLADILAGETFDAGITALVICLGTILKHYPDGDGPERLVMVVKSLKRIVLKQDT